MFQVGAGAGAGIYVSLGAGAELFFLLGAGVGAAEKSCGSRTLILSLC